MGKEACLQGAEAWLLLLASPFCHAQHRFGRGGRGLSACAPDPCFLLLPTVFFPQARLTHCAAGSFP